MKKKLTFSFLIVCLALSFPVQIQSAEQPASEGWSIKAKALMTVGAVAAVATIYKLWSFYFKNTPKEPSQQTNTQPPTQQQTTVKSLSDPTKKQETFPPYKIDNPIKITSLNCPATIGLESVKQTNRWTNWRSDIIATLKKIGYEKTEYKTNQYNILLEAQFILVQKMSDIKILKDLQQKFITEKKINTNDDIYTIKLMGSIYFKVPYYVAINPTTFEVKGLIKKDTQEWIDVSKDTTTLGQKNEPLHKDLTPFYKEIISTLKKINIQNDLISKGAFFIKILNDENFLKKYRNSNKNRMNDDDFIYTIQLIGNPEESKVEIPYYIVVNLETLRVITSRQSRELGSCEQSQRLPIKLFLN